MTKVMKIDYDKITGIIEIDGLKFSQEIFEFFKEAANFGKTFRFVNEKDGVITVDVPEKEADDARHNDV